MKKETKKKIGLLIVGAIIFVIFIFPLYWMLVTALKTQVEIFQIPTPLWPKDLTFEAFQKQLSASSDTLRGFLQQLYHRPGSHGDLHHPRHPGILRSGQI